MRDGTLCGKDGKRRKRGVTKEKEWRKRKRRDTKRRLN